MPKYNVKRESVVKVTASHEGGKAYTQTPIKELVGMLSTGISNTFYEKEGDREKRLRKLIDQIAKKDKKLAAQALIYARSVFGQRTVTHLGSVNLLPYLSGDELGKKFFSKRSRNKNEGGIIYRLDDMGEILSCYIAKNKIDINGKWTVPGAIKKGFKSAIENADKYQLAKYQMKRSGVSLVDIVNLVHPVETDTNGFVYISESDYKEAIKGTKFAKSDYTVLEDGNVKITSLRALVLGLLKQFNTVENKNTETGKKVSADIKAGKISKEEATKVLNEQKAENYAELIDSKKNGYLALLRNIRNIIKTGDSTLLTKACELLQNKDMIRKSLVWPHQIDLALEVMLLEFNSRTLQKVATALNRAYELSIPNLDELLPEGRTAVVVDTSGSMSGRWNRVQINNSGKTASINSSPLEKAALIGATFVKCVGGRLYQFSSRTEEINGINPIDSINTMKKIVLQNSGRVGHGTQMDTIFKCFDSQRETYDRVLIITDEQSASNLESSAKAYGAKYGTPYIYFINVCGYANTAMKENNKVFRLNGYSADIYEKIKEVEIDPNVIIKAIREIEI